MGENKYFKKFFIKHDAAVDKGLSELEDDMRMRNYFKPQILDWLAKNNDFRRENKTVLEELYVHRHEKSLSEVKQQRLKLLESLGVFRGKS